MNETNKRFPPNTYSTLKKAGLMSAFLVFTKIKCDYERNF